MSGLRFINWRHAATTPGTGLLLARSVAGPKVGDYSWHGTSPGPCHRSKRCDVSAASTHHRRSAARLLVHCQQRRSLSTVLSGRYTVRCNRADIAVRVSSDNDIEPWALHGLTHATCHSDWCQRAGFMPTLYKIRGFTPTDSAIIVCFADLSPL